jgi:hypothetical protein
MDMRGQLADTIYQFIDRVRSIAPFALSAAKFAFMQFMKNFVNLWRGVPKTTEKIADECLDNALAAGWPTIHDRYLYWTVRVVTFVVFVIEWVGFSFVTVFIVRWIF